ncbi:MAG: NAD-dependent epimerase/dehydratase family protein, partial [Candidatus Omnitrophica bacterium]|nr:NAD-dependent epimerase/dehydratase family protein [Candidatus Omnitrophota bacterium]
MQLLLSGSSGFLGSALLPRLRGAGHRVTRLVRRVPLAGEDATWWEPQLGRLEPSLFEGFDAVVHLAGEPLVGRRWTPAQKARIRESRVQGTRLLARTLAQASRPPRVLVCASAIGYYGHRGEDVLREDSAPGRGFLAQLCQEWEAAT